MMSDDDRSRSEAHQMMQSPQLRSVVLAVAGKEAIGASSQGSMGHQVKGAYGASSPVPRGIVKGSMGNRQGFIRASSRRSINRRVLWCSRG
jgi:hypothetical protein